MQVLHVFFNACECMCGYECLASYVYMYYIYSDYIGPPSVTCSHASIRGFGVFVCMFRIGRVIDAAAHVSDG